MISDGVFPLNINEIGKMSLNHSIVTICKHNRDGGNVTRHDRLKDLTRCAKELREMGYRLMDIRNLKPKHIEALAEYWKVKGISHRTIHNRMSHLRWVAEKIGKEGIVRDNKDYGIERRIKDPLNASQEKVERYLQGDLNKITDPYTRLSARFQAQFGLRNKECTMIQPGIADRGDYLAIRKNWAKSGKDRNIPIRTAEQRRLLDEAKAFVGNKSLIPQHLSAKQGKDKYVNDMRAAGFGSRHGARHLYAQTRYGELTGMKCAAQGGLSRSDLPKGLKDIDDKAREIIMVEMGHGRDRRDVIVDYLGG